MKVLDRAFGKAVAWEDKGGITVVRPVGVRHEDCVPNADKALSDGEYVADMIDLIEGGVCIEHYSFR